MSRADDNSPSPVEVALAMREFDASLDLLDHAVATALGIGRTDLRAMELISRGGPKTAGELAVDLGVTTGAVTALIGRMEKAGLLRRMRSTADRRQVHVELTANAKHLEARVFGPLARETAKAIGRFSGAERAVIVDFLRRAKEISDRARAGLTNPKSRSPA